MCSDYRKKGPMFYLTRDGFTFLAMGFTGKVAVEFKETYINAFNEMEKAIWYKRIYFKEIQKDA
ncbi:Rha family transcriptional regulator [Bacteroides salyersiae]|uniref:Rha family transcriptional regulator n=1 Tax=Bacteroides salyersiae TaxID=291644 RepID=UPI0021AB8F83|nr:Rha family transcriptional regulator [Bacteroides salyersiae]